MKSALLKTCLAAAALSAAPAAHALTTTLHVGPPSLGTGGSNPLSVPPVNPYEYELVILTQSGFETSVGIVPGILLGQRTKFSSGAYVSFGGGLVIDANGQGPGVYSAFGFDYGSTWALNFEFKQAVGFSFDKDSVLCPYALRIGVSYNW